jgi:hypothetical protein
VRLAARLTGWRIDIRSESQLAQAALAGVEAEAVEVVASAVPDVVEEATLAAVEADESVVVEEEVVASAEVASSDDEAPAEKKAKSRKKK